MNIIQQETELYEEVHSLENYAKMSPGEKFLPIFLENAPLYTSINGLSFPTMNVLDMGCASGKAGVALHKKGYNVILGDITDSGLIDEAKSLPFRHINIWSHIPTQLGTPQGAPIDYIICCDVLEHLPTQFTMLAINNLITTAKHGVFLTISTQSDWFGAWVGKSLHQTVQPYDWWKDNISELGKIVDGRDLIKTAVFFVKKG